MGLRSPRPRLPTTRGDWPASARGEVPCGAGWSLYLHRPVNAESRLGQCAGMSPDGPEQSPVRVRKSACVSYRGLPASIQL